MDCVFCRIAAGRETARIIFEDDDMLAFLDAAPLVPGHALLIPKEHHSSIVGMPEDLQGKLMVTASRLAVAVMKAVKADGFNLLLANGTCAGQVIRHAHINIVPRTPLDGLFLPPPGGAELPEARAQEIIRGIKKRLMS